jgi:NAD(P)-dependent dehydrogenase (short-subunit alcohol dehydrogenase family)
MADQRVVLITGCSSGIGREAARRFASEGFRVYASMRRPEQAADLRAEAVERGWALVTPALDVTSDASVAGAVSALLTETGGRLDVLVNNAGYYILGPLEETSPDELRALYETNVLGPQRLMRAVLPAMRARGGGAIVNVSSVAGRIAVPVAGAYHSSKWALEALCETWRYELAPFGVRVTIVEPGAFKTALHDKEVRPADFGRPDSPYRPLVEEYLRRSNLMKRRDPGPVVDVILRAATVARPRLRWAVGPNSLTGTLVRRLTPDAIYELVLGLAFRWRRARGQRRVY